ncbi:hypothetical protein BC938DRAFT_478743, partial [Jimgerdemannia flammicorona]
DYFVACYTFALHSNKSIYQINLSTCPAHTTEDINNPHHSCKLHHRARPPTFLDATIFSVTIVSANSSNAMQSSHTLKMALDAPAAAT